MSKDRVRRDGIATALAIALPCLSAPAVAQVYVSPLCPPPDKSQAASPFDDAAHERWNRRFWTGSCEGLFLCRPGEPNWNAELAQLARRARPERRAALVLHACALGRLVGREWARDNRVRRLDTAWLQLTARRLSQASDIEAALDAAYADALSRTHP